MRVPHQDQFLAKALWLAASIYLLVAGPAFASSPTELERAVVRVIGSNNQIGSGFLFFISSMDRGNIAYVITAHHVVKDYDLQNRFEVYFNFSSSPCTAKVEYPHQESDLAILALNNYPMSVKPLKFGDPRTIASGSRVCVYGYPGGGEIRRDDGTVSSLSGAKIYLDDIEPDNGNSGGPVLDVQTNKVLGMIIQKAKNVSDQYAVNIQGIKTIVESNIIFRPPEGKRKPIDATLVGSVTVRSKPEELSEKDVRKMIFEKGFYEREINPSGNGIVHLYETYAVLRGSMQGMSAGLVPDELAKSLGMEKPSGALVTEVEANSLADYAGFERGDIVVEFDGQKVDHHEHLVKLIHGSEVGKTVNVKMMRDGKPVTMDVRIGSGEDRVVMDHVTGLMWQRNASRDLYVDHQLAEGWISHLNYFGFAGHSDWRLPTLEEALSIMESEQKRQYSGKYLDPVFEGAYSEIWTADRYYQDWYWKVNYDDAKVWFSRQLGHFRAVRGR